MRNNYHYAYPNIIYRHYRDLIVSKEDLCKLFSMEMTQYAKYTSIVSTQEFVKYGTFRELLELPCQLLD